MLHFYETVVAQACDYKGNDCGFDSYLRNESLFINIFISSLSRLWFPSLNPQRLTLRSLCPPFHYIYILKLNKKYISFHNIFSVILSLNILSTIPYGGLIKTNNTLKQWLPVCKQLALYEYTNDLTQYNCITYGGSELN